MEFLGRRRYFEATEGLIVEGWRAHPYSERAFFDR